MSYIKILRSVLLFGLGLIFFVPFIIADGSFMTNMFFPYITGKNFTFRILVEVLLGVYILLALREPKYRPTSSMLLWAACAFTVWMGLATAFSIDPIKSFWSNFERMDGYITVLHFFVYFVIAGAVVTAEEWWEKLFGVSVAASSMMGLYAVLQAMGVLTISSQSGVRVDATFGNAAYLAVYMLFNVFLTLFLLVRYRKVTYAQALLGIALVLQVATIYLTETRGAFLGLIGGLIIAAGYIAIFGRERETVGLRKVALWALGAIAILVVAFFALRSTPLMKTGTLGRLASISLTDPTTMSRFVIWNMAVKGAMERPVTGWGQENFSYVFNQNYEPKMYNQEQWFDRAHNQFLDWFIAGGVPAFLLYIAFFGLAAWVVVTAGSLTTPERAIFLGLLAAYAFNNLLLFHDLMSALYFFLILAFLHGLSKRSLHKHILLSRPMHNNGIAVVAPIVAVMVVVMVWTLNAPGIARAQNLLNAVLSQMSDGKGGVVQKDPKTHLDQFTVALGPGVWPGTPLGYQESAEQLLQFSSAQSQSNSVDPATKKSTHDLAEAAGKTILAQRPDDARLELFFGAFYDAFGQKTEALEYLKRALEDSPNKQQIQFQIGVAHLNSNNIPSALAVLKAAFESEPNYRDARILYAAGLMYANERPTADKLLMEGPKEQGFGTVYVDDPRLLQVYTNTKQHDRVVGIWKSRIAADEKNPQQHIGLASAYFAAGDAANTIKSLRDAAALDPNMATEIGSVIKQIQDGTLKPGQ